MSKVSVVVPIYNAGNKLRRCITSILNQTFKDIEVILVNDGSSDNSLEICRSYEDKRIKIINQANGGCILARKRGIEEAKSDLLMFVDADDWINKYMIEILYNEAVKNDLDIAICNIIKVSGKGILYRNKNKSVYFKNDKIYNEQEIKSQLVVAYFHGHPFPPSLCAKLYKRNLLLGNGKYLENIKFLGEDLYFNLEILLKSKKVKIIRRPLYYYRIGGFTSRFMPFLFSDIINGYIIQKEVIDTYFKHSQQNHYNGISIMLLNTFQTCLLNLFNGGLNEIDIKKHIKCYVDNNILINTLENEGAKIFFPPEYLSAIRQKKVDTLYELGLRAFKKRKPKKIVLDVLSKISL